MGSSRPTVLRVGLPASLSLLVLGSLSGALCLAGTAALRGSPRDEVLRWAVAALVPYGVLHARGLAGLDPRRVAWLALAAQLPALLAPPTFSDDAFRYVWDARVAAHGIDPFAFAPDDSALRSQRDAAWERINHREIPTIYPLAAQAVFLLGRAFGPASPLLGLKLVLALALHATARLVAASASRDRAGAMGAVLLHPLLVLETCVDAHVDVVVGLALVAAWLARGRLPLVAGALVGVAAGVKLVGLLVWPVALGGPRTSAKQSWRGPAAALVVGIALAAPLAVAGQGSGRDGGALEFARRWEGNAGVYVLIERGLTALAAAGADRRGRVDAPALAWLDGSPLHPHRQRPERKRPATPTVVYADELGRWLARLCVVGLALTFSLRPGAGRSLRGVRDTLLVVLLLSPQLHPWYLGWVLAPEIAAGGWAASVLGAAALLAHVAGPAPWAVAAEHVLGWCALALDRPRSGWTRALGRGSHAPEIAGGTTWTTSRSPSD
jgi:hypothetical protein